MSMTQLQKIAAVQAILAQLTAEISAITVADSAAAPVAAAPVAATTVVAAVPGLRTGGSTMQAPPTKRHVPPAVRK
jgi:hypothetical protein